MIKLYIANLGKYNEGELKGAWITLPIDSEDFQEVLKNEVGINEHYEEIAIHDSETDIEGLDIGEYDSIPELNEFAERYELLHDYQKEILEAVTEWGYFGSGTTALIEALESVEDFYLLSDVHNDSDYGYYIVDEQLLGVEIPQCLQYHINYESLGADWSQGDCYYSNNGLVIRC